MRVRKGYAMKEVLPRGCVVNDPITGYDYRITCYGHRDAGVLLYELDRMSKNGVTKHLVTSHNNGVATLENGDVVDAKISTVVKLMYDDSEKLRAKYNPRKYFVRKAV
jgi:hypothetical protein